MKKIGFQGVLGAYSEMALYGYFGSKVTSVPCKDFSSVFSAVESGRLDYGVIPIENSVAGSIHENYDHLQKRRVFICGEYKLRVSHNLLTLKKTKLEDLCYVYSHPQALAQCATFLKGLKNVELVPYFDTAGSAKFVAEKNDVTVAAIASTMAKKRYGLKALCSEIEDVDTNVTRFLVIEKKKETKKRVKSSKKVMKTSIVFSLKNLPGCLHRCLSIFAIRDIDLHKIESRPIPDSPFKYVFYLDFAGGMYDEAAKKALLHLSEITDFLKVLGSYEEAERVK